MKRFVEAIGGPTWGEISAQYYQSNYNGNDSNAGTRSKSWRASGMTMSLPFTTISRAIELAQEAARAVQHFHITDLANSQIVVAHAQKYNDAGFNQNGYCAYHDYTTPVSYPGVQSGNFFCEHAVRPERGWFLRERTSSTPRRPVIWMV